jgi:hypothetical protein
MMPIEAQWALWSERPDARDDYTVLNCSNGLLRAPHFRRLITRFSPGSPDGDAALPRMTVGTVDIEGAPHLGLAIQAYSRHKDGVGRNIAPTSYFCLSYAALAERRVSYLGLYRALSEIKLAATGGGPPVRIDPDPLTPPSVTAALEEFGADTIRAAASLLLTKNRRICVTQAEQTTVEERLRFLDAVAALLPYGYRSKITMSTWANSATKHRLRLFFARNARDVGEPGFEVTPLPWLGKNEPSWDRNAERDHFDLLAKVLDRHHPTEVVRLLATRTAPTSFDEPEAAVRALHEVDERLLRASRLDAGKPTLDDLRGEIDDHIGGDDEGGDPERLSALLRRLMEQGDGTDLERIERGLGRLDERVLSGLVRGMLDMARRLLWSAADVRLQGLLGPAEACGYHDWFLRELIGPPADIPVPENGLNAAAQLLATNAIGDPGAYPRTCEALGHNIPIAVRMIALLVLDDDDGGLATGRELVKGKLPRELSRPLDIAMGEGRQKAVTQQDIAALAGHGRGCLHAVLEIACHRQRLDRVLDAFAEWLLSGGGFRPDQEEYWKSRLDGLAPADPALRGKLDVLLLMAAGQPVSMTQVVQEDWNAYQAAFIATWKRDWPDLPRMTRGLAAHLAAQRWQEGGKRADNVLELVHLLFPVGERSLDEALEVSFRAARHLTQAPQAAQWLANRPHPGPPTNRLTAASRFKVSIKPPASPPASADEALALILDSCRRGKTPDAAYAALTGLITDAAIALDVVRRLPATLAARDMSMQEAHEWAYLLISRLCGGIFGHDIAAEFARKYLDTIVRRLKEEVVLLQDFDTLTGHEWRKDHGALRAVEHLSDRLAELADSKQKGGRWRHGKGRNPRGEQPREPLRGDGLFVWKRDNEA